MEDAARGQGSNEQTHHHDELRRLVLLLLVQVLRLLREGIVLRRLVHGAVGENGGTMQRTVGRTRDRPLQDVRDRSGTGGLSYSCHQDLRQRLRRGAHSAATRAGPARPLG